MRRLSLCLLFVVMFASVAWPKINKNDKEYLDEKIQQLTDQMAATQKQIAALSAQMQALRTQLTDMQKAQADLHLTLQHQGESLNDLLQSLNIMRQSHSTDMGSITDRLNVLSNQIKEMLSTASPARPAAEIPEPVVPAVTATPPAPAGQGQAQAPPGQEKVEGFIIAVNGADVTVGLGSDTGVRLGSKLALYKKADPRAQVGELEVISVMDGSNSHARISNLNNGVQPEFQDIVRLEQR